MYINNYLLLSLETIVCVILEFKLEHITKE